MLGKKLEAAREGFPSQKGLRGFNHFLSSLLTYSYSLEQKA